MHPAPEETLDRLGAEPVANLLERPRILTRPEAVIQRLVPNAGMLKLPLCPFVAVEPQPNRKWGVGVGLPKGPAPLGIPEVKVEMIHEGHLPAPLHVRMRVVFLTLPGPRAPSRGLLLRDPDQHHAVFSLARRRV